MKTAVSIPDRVFEKIERLARRAGRSRSEIACARRSATSRAPLSAPPAIVCWRASSGDVALDKPFLIERVGKLSTAKVELVLSGIDVVLGR